MILSIAEGKFIVKSHSLVNALKKLLKTRNMTYRQVAQGLGLSEASIKRLFTTGNFTLARVDQICLLMGLEIADLVRMAESTRQRLNELTEEQENELVSDTRLLLVAFLVINGWAFDAIYSEYKFTEPELISCFIKLDKLKLIEFLPNNRFKLLTTTNFSWRKNGPILTLFTERMKQDYFVGKFQEKNEAIMFAPGMLSETSCETLLKKMELLVSDFNAVNHRDAALSIEQRSAFSMVVALRPWKPSIFSELRKV
jgi:DNA-binding Xre family transcriptional regulator